MASVRSRVASESDEILTLHELFRIVGDQMTPGDLVAMKQMHSELLDDELWAQIHDGFTFFLALEKRKKLDESNLKCILTLLRATTRHDLTEYVTLRKRRAVDTDPVDTFLELRFTSKIIMPFSRKRGSTTMQPSASPTTTTTTTTTTNNNTLATDNSKPEKPVSESVGHDHTTETINTPQSQQPPQQPQSQPQTERHNKTLEEMEERSASNSEHPLMSLPPDESSWIPPHKRRKSDRSRKKTATGAAAAAGEGAGKDSTPKKITCDIRLRVRAEYCNHQSVLQGNVFSNKPTPIERQFEKFLQANTILKSRDLGSIHCDIKFSELTYLDAFWRDYVNGALLEALKGVFITESLKQAVGHEAIKLLVNVDEDDYNSGRLKLLENLVDRHPNYDPRFQDA